MNQQPHWEPFPPPFPTRFPSLAPAMLLRCRQPHALLQLKNRGLRGTQGELQLSGAQRGQGPSGHPGDIPWQTYLARAAPRMPPWPSACSCCGGEEGLAKLGREKGRKPKGFGQKRKERAHKGRKKKSRVRARSRVTWRSPEAPEPSLLQNATGSRQRLAMPAVGPSRHGHPQHILPVPGIWRGSLLPCPVSTRVLGAQALLARGKAPSCVRAPRGLVTDLAAQGGTGSGDCVCQAAERPIPPFRLSCDYLERGM